MGINIAPPQQQDLDDAIPSSMQLVTVVRKGLVGTSLKFGALESKIHIFPTISVILLGGFVSFPILGGHRF